MSLKQRFIYTPSSSSYSHEDSASPYLRVQLDGGRGRYRASLLTASKLVDVQWILEKAGYDYAMMFYSLYQRRPQEFDITLIIGDAEPRDYAAMILPGTFRLTAKRGNVYTISAQLEVMPNATNEDYGDLYISLVSYFGEDWRLYEARLNIIVNHDLPLTMPIPVRPF